MPAGTAPPGGQRQGIKGAPKEQAASTGATDAVCGVVEKVEAIAGNKKAKKLSVDIGTTESLVIVTSWDVSEKMRVVIAVLGSLVNEAEVVESVIAGVTSQGLLCDAAMLGWEGGVEGTPALLPSTFTPGDSAPSDKPRRAAAKVDEPAFAGFDAVDEGPTELFEKKLTKEEKKAEAAKKKAAREAKKNGGEASTSPEDGSAPSKPRVKPSKAEVKKIKKATEEKRKANPDADIHTDDELEAAGFLCEGEE
eukprot:CAMPEP_0115857348 /NCGR_PEP_ID=MMETSP0287-20121206/15529_1 /TAXON_ID=412157 /ORGANISM="Chrysochromulina rotalis, Strain UIO044" /LENGTH=250 /DNA_ID=CAMNT_0003311565 /DNA_START=13 /DNA_END=765 /DNA_ORIENTATION=+